MLFDVNTLPCGITCAYLIYNRWQISSKLENKNLDADQRRHLGNLETKLVSKMKELELPCTDQKTLAKQRNQKIVARCFHKIGIIVPYDKKTELGYRPLPMNDRKWLYVRYIILWAISHIVDLLVN